MGAHISAASANAITVETFMAKCLPWGGKMAARKRRDM